MLFPSQIFLFVFLPITFALWLAADRTRSGDLRWIILIAASFVFYAYFKWSYIFLLSTSMLLNYSLSRLIIQAQKNSRATRAQILLVGALALNIGTLGIFKYAAFVVGNIDAVFSRHIPVPHIALPLAISFFTFQQIAYLVDVYRFPARRTSLIEYCFFTVFFPHLIAGPICYSTDIVPQMHEQRTKEQTWQDAQAGFVAFVIGLFKKVALAGQFQAIADPIFSASSAPSIGATDAWSAVVAYSLQIYFDFSAYSDMAIGLGLLFGIRLPLNFYSPYKASSIIEFWRCWHITLSRFLRDYLYIPLGGSRVGEWRTAANLMFVMVLAGLWHGAGWTFVLWGGIHGALLIANHAWRALRRGHRRADPAIDVGARWLGRITTFVLVSLAWIPFRASNIAEAGRVFEALWHFPSFSVGNLATVLGLGCGVAICWLLPNTAQLLERYTPVCTEPPRELSFDRQPWQLRVRFNPVWACSMAVLIFAVIRGSLDRGVDVFIYYRF